MRPTGCPYYSFSVYLQFGNTQYDPPICLSGTGIGSERPRALRIPTDRLPACRSMRKIIDSHLRADWTACSRAARLVSPPGGVTSAETSASPYSMTLRDPLNSESHPIGHLTREGARRSTWRGDGVNNQLLDQTGASSTERPLSAFGGSQELMVPHFLREHTPAIWLRSSPVRHPNVNSDARAPSRDPWNSRHTIGPAV